MDADTRRVSVETDEVQLAMLAVSLDYVGEAFMNVELLPSNDSTESCPVLRDDARWTFMVDGQATALEVISLGGGSVGVDCALKCRDLVALENVCAPAIARLEGPALEELLTGTEGRDLQLVLEDETGSVTQSLPGISLERRSVEFEGGTTIAMSADSVARVPFAWSHPDDLSIWANDYPDPYQVAEGDEFGRFRALPQDGGPVLSIGARDSFGPHDVYMGSTIGVAACAVGECSVRHTLLQTITIVAE